MPKFEIAAPDGSRYEVEGPNEAGAIAALKAHLSGQKPAAPSMKDQAADIVDQAADFAQGLGGGVKKGVLQVAGLPADVGSLVQSGLDWGRSKVQGRPLAEVQAESEAAAVIPKASLDRYGGAGLIQGYRDNAGEIYEPRRFAGRVGQAIGEFAPSSAIPLGNVGMLTRLGMGAALPGVTSAAVTEATGSPLLGAATAFASPFVVSRVTTPVRGVASRERSLAALADEGVTSLTAGQRTGSYPLQWVESTIGDSIGAGSAARRATDKGLRQFTAAGARRMGSEADQLTPEAFREARQRLSRDFRRLSSQHTLDAQAGGLTPRITAAIQDHVQDMTPENQRRFMNIITDRIAPNMIQGQMPGARYQALRSSLTNIAKGAQGGPDRPFELGVRQLRNALDDAMGDSITATGNAADAALWRTSREQWGAMRTLEDAMNKAGPTVAGSILTPANLRSAAADQNAYARGTTELNNLSRAGVEIMSPLPQSGTGPREGARAALSAGGAFFGGQAAGAEGAALGALAPILAPAIAGRAIMSGGMQAWLGNRTFQQDPDTWLRAALRARMSGE